VIPLPLCARGAQFDIIEAAVRTEEGGAEPRRGRRGIESRRRSDDGDVVDVVAVVAAVNFEPKREAARTRRSLAGDVVVKLPVFSVAVRRPAANERVSI